MLVFIQSKTVGVTKVIRTLNDTNDIIVCGSFEGAKGLGAKIKPDGSFHWTYLFPLSCESMTLDSKQDRALFVLKFPNRGLELHNYNLKDGGKDFIYEYELTDIDSIHDSKYANDYYWITGYRTSTECFVLKLSKTRRYVYM